MADDMNRNPPESVPDLLLERYLLGELPEGARLHLEVRLGSDPELRNRLESLRASDAEILKQHPPESVAWRLQARLRRENAEKAIRTSKGPSFLWRLELSPRAATMLATACLLALVVIPAWLMTRGESPAGTEVSGTQVVDSRVLETDDGADGGKGAEADNDAPSSALEERDRTEEEPLIIAMDEADPSAPDERGVPGNDTRIKGLEPALALFRKTGSGAEPLQPGAKARPGDVLRIGYRSGGLRYGAIFSVDGDGNVTRHWPLAGDSAGRLEGGEALLPGAFELDAAPEYERFYLLASERVFPLNPVLESLHDQKPPSPKVKGDIKVVRFDILKDSGI